MAVAASAAALTGIGKATTDALATCPGYSASNVKTTTSGLTADLTLAGKACNVYGTDLKDLTLTVSYDTGRLSFLSFTYRPAQTGQLS
jgi:alpha-glucosidase